MTVIPNHNPTQKEMLARRLPQTLDLVDVLGSDESISRNSYSANVAKSLLEGNRDYLLTQTRSELMKLEQKVESLDNCINELQQRAYDQRLELEDAHSRIR